MAQPFAPIKWCALSAGVAAVLTLAGMYAVLMYGPDTLVSL